VQPETHIRGNKNKKKIKQADFPAKAPESSSDKCETGNAERSMHDLSCESPKECFPNPMIAPRMMVVPIKQKSVARTGYSKHENRAGRRHAFQAPISFLR
jgi:hypothetical protein